MKGLFKKVFYCLNAIVALVAMIDWFVWGMNLSSSTLLWMNGKVTGYLGLILFGVVLGAFCMTPSWLIKDFEKNTSRHIR